MDALSHALITYILFSAPGLSSLIPFAIVGAVIADADILFPAVSDRIPSLYLFTHGGIAHSIAGSIALSLSAYGGILLSAGCGLIPVAAPVAAGVYGFAAILAGCLLHIAIDLSAVPGIPLLAPFSDRKYTLGILPGPSLLLAFCGLWVVIATAAQLLPLSYALVLYGCTVIAYLGLRAGVFLFVDAKLAERKVPTINPLRWLVIREDEASYTVQHYTLFSGFSGKVVFTRFMNTGPSGLAAVSHLPEVRRFLFHAYCVTAERIGEVLILADPVREKGFLYYPQKYRRVAIPAVPA